MDERPIHYNGVESVELKFVILIIVFDNMLICFQKTMDQSILQLFKGANRNNYRAGDGHPALP